MKLDNVTSITELNIQASTSLLTHMQADAVIIIGSRSEFEQATGFPGATMCAQAVRTKLFDVDEGKTYVCATGEEHIPLVIAVGRKEGAFAKKELRMSMGQAARKAVKLRLRRIVIAVPQQLAQADEREAQEMAHVITEGFLLGAYQRITYQRDVKRVHVFSSLILCASELAVHVWSEGIKSGQAYALGTVFSRDLTNLPGNILIPSTLAEQALKLAAQYGFEAEVVTEEQMKKKCMGGLLGVGKGSVHPPRMIVLKYQGQTEWTDVYGLVGKGITFDSGGISLKRAANMDEMICDMGGAAAVLGAMIVIGRLRPQVNVLCVVAAAENMPAGNALKPGDIVTSYSGRTIEVLNTDAEGRLVLADGITYAQELGATKLIDVATLTGAVVTALGSIMTGALTNNESFFKQFQRAAGRTDELVWQLPSHQQYQDMLKSDVADVRNAIPGGAGTITAGLFVGTFVDELPWIHLDIAGTTLAKCAHGINPKGATGVMVRTIADTILFNEALSTVQSNNDL